MIITGKKFSKPTMSRVINGDIKLDNGPAKVPRKRLDLLVVAEHPEFNRSTLQNFIKSGYVTVDGQVVTKPNTEVIIEPMPEIILQVPVRQTPPDIRNITIYEDDNVIVLNKPAGLLSMAKGEFTEEPTLEDYGLLVHRLDRDTSGVVILAKNEATQSFLRRQFQERKTHKTYFAIVDGTPKLPSAKIDLPIARNLKHPTTFMVDPKGKPSQTFYNTIRTEHINHRTYSLVELKPVTGRTHQLRVHLKYLGHPIIGDTVYNDKTAARTRLFLHAHALEITIPGADGGERRIFEAPIPSEFTKLLDGIIEA